MLFKEDNALCWRFDGELLRIEPWGENALRVRCTKHAGFSGNDWALTEPHAATAAVTIDERYGTIKNGKIRARVTRAGKLVFFDREKKLLEEYVRTRAHSAFSSKVDESDEASDQEDLMRVTEYTSALKLDGRELKGLPGGDFRLTARFEPNEGEKLYGMGQYQQEIFDLKGASLELAHRNSQATVPFLLSSNGYGFLWNNPAIGEATFAANRTTWQAHSTKEMDYWITAGDTPAQIERQYAAVTGKVPMMPDWAMGFWQCKLRYQTQEELLSIAGEYHRRGLPLSVIVIDYYHWMFHGDWDFDPRYWPDPEAMTRELHDMGVKLMVSVWPTVQPESVNFDEMKEKGLLIRTERGVPVAMINNGNILYFDATNPEARRFLWDTVKRNYFDKGVDLFWLDEAEPEFTVYDYENFRYHTGPNLQVGNQYPAMFSKAFYDGMTGDGVDGVINLVRCAWAGSQKYGALVWSGDVDSSFRALREQLVAGLHMGIAGIPWWTTDIGGFQGADSRTPEFAECLLRWFAFGAFSPVFRLHGARAPFKKPMSDVGGGKMRSGSDNEIWSYGPEAEAIMTRFLWVREAIRPYIKGLMAAAHKDGAPVLRALFYEFPQDEAAWDVKDQFMLGGDLLIAPVMEPGLRSRDVYLPAGTTWVGARDGRVYRGGQTIACEAPLSDIPVLVRQGNDALLEALQNAIAKKG